MHVKCSSKYFIKTSHFFYHFRRSPPFLGGSSIFLSLTWKLGEMLTGRVMTRVIMHMFIYHQWACYLCWVLEQAHSPLSCNGFPAHYPLPSLFPYSERICISLQSNPLHIFSPSSLPPFFPPSFLPSAWL